MLDDASPTLPGLGHNNPPDALGLRKDVAEAHAAKAAEFLDAAGAWLKAGDIPDEEQAKKLNDFMAGVRAVKDGAEEDRVKDRAPINKLGQEIQDAYNPIKKKLDAALNKVDPLMRDWMRREKNRKAAEARKAKEEAEAAARAAEEAAAKAAARNDISGQVDAEKAAKDAEKARKAAEKKEAAPVRVGSATGGAKTRGQRTTWVAEIDDMRIAFMRYCTAPELQDCLLKLAAAEARSKDFDPRTQTIPGFTLHERIS